jgi:hypothetical protein
MSKGNVRSRSLDKMNLQQLFLGAPDALFSACRSVALAM